MTLDPDESAYIDAKTKTSLYDWRSYLENAGLDDLDISAFVPLDQNAVPGDTVPLIGIAAAGGGQR